MIYDLALVETGYEDDITNTTSIVYSISKGSENDVDMTLSILKNESDTMYTNKMCLPLYVSI